MARDDWYEQNPYLAPEADLGVGPGKAITDLGPDPNLWKTVWTRPKATIRHVVSTNPTNNVLLLAALGGIANGLGNAWQFLEQPQVFTTVVAAAVVLGGLFGIVAMYINGALWSWVGGWFGGRGTQEQLRAAYAWSQVPGVAILALYVVAVPLGLAASTGAADAGALLGIGALVLLPVLMVLGIWSLVILFHMMGEVLGMSAWGGLGIWFLSGLVLLVLIFVPLLVLIFLVGMLAGISA